MATPQCSSDHRSLQPINSADFTLAVSADDDISTSPPTTHHSYSVTSEQQDFCSLQGTGLRWICHLLDGIPKTGNLMCRQKTDNEKSIRPSAGWWPVIVMDAHSTQLNSLNKEPRIEWEQAIADILHSALCCHSNETRALVPNPSNSEQQGGTSYHSPSYIWVHAVVWTCSEGQTDRQTHIQTHGIKWPIYISHHLRIMWKDSASGRLAIYR